MATRKTDIVRRSLFGSDPADEAAKSGPRARRQPRAAAEPASAPQSAVQVAAGTAQLRRQVERTAVTVPSELLMKVKDAVAVLNGWPHQYTMARFVEEAFAAHLERLKLDFNGGREFPVTNRKIRTGRPPGT